jgi:hypothetical protein
MRRELADSQREETRVGLRFGILRCLPDESCGGLGLMLPSEMAPVFYRVLNCDSRQHISWVADIVSVSHFITLVCGAYA